MVTFVAIDFETADPQPDSACAVGLCRVEAGTVVRREVRLVRPPRPYVHPQCYRVHGLGWSRLSREKPFAAVWPPLSGMLDGAEFLAAHNASFDRRVLDACLKAGSLPAVSLPWVCTYKLAQQRWPKPATNRLPDVCGRLGIAFSDHHEAGADAEACARVLLALGVPRPGAGELPPPRFVRGPAGPGEQAPPSRLPYWVIGQKPGAKPGTPARWEMEQVPAGGECPPWATKWTREGMAAWATLPPLVEAEDAAGAYRPRSEQPLLFGAATDAG